MSRYYVNKNAQSNGDHEVHTTGCSCFPAEQNVQYLGDFNSCRLAITEARKHYTKVDGCCYCCKACHTQ